jgi:chromosome segregation ATPase
MKRSPDLSPTAFTRKDYTQYSRTPHARFTLPELKESFSPENKLKLKQQNEAITYMQKVVEGNEKELLERDSQLYKVKNDYRNYMNRAGKFSLDSAEIDQIYTDLKTAVSGLDEATEKILKKQEVRMVNYYNAKLKSVSLGRNQEKEKKLKEVHEMNKDEAQAIGELEVLKASVDFIESQNARLLEENKRLKAEISSRDQQVLLITQKLLKYKHKYNIYQDQIKKLVINTTSSIPGSSTTSPITSPNNSVAESRISPEKKFQDYKRTIQKLRKSLSREKKNLHLVNMQYSKELDSKHEIESILRDCISDVRKELNKQSKDWRNVQFRKMLVDKLSKQEDLLNFLHKSLISTLNSTPLLTAE